MLKILKKHLAQNAVGDAKDVLIQLLTAQYVNTIQE
jgi:hypothetical protein